MSASGSQPVDLSTPKKSSDITSSVSVPRLPPAPGSKRSGSSSIFGAPNSRIQSFDSFNAAGQPVLDLHSALNGIQKSFTIGSGNQSRPGQQQQLLPPPPLMRNSCIGRNGVSSNGGNSRSSSSGSNLSPSPPPCPAPNNMHLWASLAAASSFGKSLEQNFAAFNIPTRNFTPPQYLGYPGCPGNEGVPTKSMRISSGCSLGTSTQLTDSRGSIRDSPSLSSSSPVAASASAASQMSKYNQLLTLLDEMSKDIRPSYAGSKSSAERLKRGIAHARILVREAEIEADRNARKQD